MAESTQELASRWQRLWGALLDALIAMAIVFPVMWISGVWQQLMRGAQMSVEQRIWLFIFGVILFFILQGYLLAKHGQTIGKRIVGTRIVSAEDGRILPLSRIFWLRNLPASLVAQIPTFGPWISVIDSLFIFRKDKRCIHDLIAGTKVIKVRPQSSGGYAAEASAPIAAVAGRAEMKMSSEKENSTAMNDDAFYDEVAKEIETNNLVPGVWTRAFAEADGDENRAKAIYIKLRVAKLLDAERQLQHIRAEEERLAEDDRLTEEYRLAARKRRADEKLLAEEEMLKGKSELFKQWYKDQKESGVDFACKEPPKKVGAVWAFLFTLALVLIASMLSRCAQ